MRPKRTPRSAPPAQETRSYEVEVIPGLEAIAADELQRRLRSYVTIEPGYREGLIPIRYSGDPAALLDLRTVLAVYTRHYFAVPRPKALLGQSAFDTLLKLIAEVRAQHARNAFQTLRISAAGQESSVMLRLRDELSRA
ncbi:MAG TPA: hypothetical protein VGD69_12310, partial [Herpetosiphonaceae bacterium]